MASSSCSSSSPPSPSSAWVRAGRLSDLPQGEGKRIQLPGGGRKDAVAVFRHGSELYALEDRCCHADKSIHGGDIEDLGQCVINKHGDMGAGGLCVQCPRHQRKFAGGLYFNLKTGEARTPEYTRKFRKMDTHYVRVHETRVENGEVFVSVRPRPRSAVQAISDDSEDDPPRRPHGLLAKLCSHLPSSGRRSPPGSSPTGAPSEKRPREDDDDDKNNVGGDAYTLSPLLDVEQVNHDCFVFHLGQPQGTPLPPAPSSPVWHVTLRARIGGKMVDRDYTPISPWEEWRDSSRVRLLIKIYPDGLMTQYLAKLGKGRDAIEMSGPISTLQLPSFDPPGSAIQKASVPSHFMLFAAGTGVVPMVQILESLNKLPGWTSVTLLCSYRSPVDVLCAEAILGLVSSARMGSIQLWCTFTSVGSFEQHRNSLPAAWQGVSSEGRADASLCDRLLSHVPSDVAVKVIVSGPDGFFEAMKDALPTRLRAAASCVNLDEE